MPAEREHAILRDSSLLKLERQLQELESISKDSFELAITKKRIEVLKHRLEADELERYRKDWVQKRQEDKILSREKSTTSDVARRDMTQTLFAVLSERHRLAKMIPSDELLSHSETLSVVRDLLTLCTRNYRVLYRPGQDPSVGRCSVEGCNISLDE